MKVKMDKRMNLFKDSNGYLLKGFELCIQKKAEIEARLMVYLPNIPAMYLNIADKAKESAKEIYQINLEPHIAYIETNNHNENYFEFKMKIMKNIFTMFWKICLYQLLLCMLQSNQ